MFLRRNDRDKGHGYAHRFEPDGGLIPFVNGKTQVHDAHQWIGRSDRVDNAAILLVAQHHATTKQTRNHAKAEPLRCNEVSSAEQSNEFRRLSGRRYRSR